WSSDVCSSDLINVRVIKTRNNRLLEKRICMINDWKGEWQPMIEAIGQDFSDGGEVAGADEVEKGAIRRFLEPLEFDCALHNDENTAKEYGYEDVIASYISLY